MSETRKRLFKEGKLKMVYTPERKEKLRNSMLGHKCSNRTKEILSQTWKEKYKNGYVNQMKGKIGGMYGKKHTLETREKISKHSFTNLFL